MKKILLIVLLTITACTSKPKETSSLDFYELSKNIIQQIQDSVKDYIETPLEDDLKTSEEDHTNDANSPQNGSNEVTQPSKGISGSNNVSSNTSNKSSDSSNNNSTNNNVQTCPADNPDKFYYVDTNGEFHECPGYNDPVIEEKPTYVCEFAKFDKNKPCDWIPPGQEEYDYGPFSDLHELWNDSEGRGIPGPRTYIKYIYDNNNRMYFVYSVLPE